MTGPRRFLPDRRQLMLGTALLGIAGIAAALRPATVPVTRLNLDRAIPLALGRYRYDSATGLVLPDTGETSQRIYDQVVTRVYIAAGRSPVMLVVAYGTAQDAGLALHRPDACYPAAGYRIAAVRQVDAAPHTTHSIPATLLTATREDHVEQVLFWTRIGDSFPTSALAEKLDVLRANLSGERPDGVLVRVSVRDPDRGAALGEMRQFVATMLAALTPVARTRLAGAA
jgi:EpsI family protein